MRNLKTALIILFVLVVYAVGNGVQRQSIAASQDSVAGQTDIGLQRRQVRALERIATELTTANRQSRRCR